jgi:hypothetical protein
MKYNLPPLFITVDGDPKALLGDAFDFGDLICCHEQGFGDALAVFFQIDQGWDVFFGNDDYMHGSRRVNVIEGKDLFIFIDLTAGDFAFDNFAKNTIIHVTTFFVIL